MGSTRVISAISPTDLRRCRAEFLSGGQQEPCGVRPEVAASWRRSWTSGVAPDALHLPYSPEIDLDGRLCRAAVPVLAALSEQLDRTDTALVLACDRARILARWSGGAGIRAALERVGAVPGTSLAEQYAGTNGLGTTVELDQPVVISGPEHFAELYQEFTCAGVPIHDPVDGRKLGVVDLVCRYDDTNPLMLPLLSSAVVEIHRLLAEDRPGEHPPPPRLFPLAVRRDRHDSTGQVRPAVVPLSPKAPGGAPPPGVRASAPPALGGLVGRSPAWHRTVAAARRHGTFRLPLVVSGEVGTGKLTLLRALWAECGRAGPVRVIDAATLPFEGCAPFHERVRAALDDPAGGLVVLRHVEFLDPRPARAIGALLDERIDRRADGGAPGAGDAVAVSAGPGSVSAVASPGREVCPAVAGTIVTDNGAVAGMAARSLLERLAVVAVTVPPLRSRPEDVRSWSARSCGRPAASGAGSRRPWPRSPVSSGRATSGSSTTWSSAAPGPASTPTPTSAWPTCPPRWRRPEWDRAGC
jgi:hypothetical protein